mmetsp:Transcript_54242/g.63386  ORF Transcript_54242/g.63386 Transcript_54242/m.63386 type:complete len:114 (-) Transcript_54242:624-965(-)
MQYNHELQHIIYALELTEPRMAAVTPTTVETLAITTAASCSGPNVLDDVACLSRSTKYLEIRARKLLPYVISPPPPAATPRFTTETMRSSPETAMPTADAATMQGWPLAVTLR